MTSDRDRLIEIIGDLPFSVEYEKYNSLEFAEHLADYLLGNGVVLLDTRVITPKNRPLITQIAGMPLNDVLDLIRAKEEGRLIIPPCKVGDLVYFYKAEINEICSAKVIGIFNNYYTPSMPLWITIEYESKLIGKQEVKMASEIFKLLCRYTKEEAEKELKEKENG